METAVLVYTTNNHRNNLQACRLMSKALELLGYKVTGFIDDEYDIAMVWNSPLGMEDLETLDFIASKVGNKLAYMYVDNDLPILDKSLIVSQFNRELVCEDISNQFYFPISRLAVFHEYWDNPLKTPKVLEGIYGGTFKERRDYSPLLDREVLITGDSKEWDYFSSIRLPTVRDLNMFYRLMSLAKETYIVYDRDHYNNNIPTRFYECVFTNTNCILFDSKGKETVYTPKVIRNTTSKEEVLAQLRNLMLRIENGR